MTKLEKDYEKACNHYIRLFSKKNDIKFDYWIANLIGGVAAFGDYYFNFQDIIWDVNSEQLPGTILKWYEEMLENNKTYYQYTNEISKN